MKKSFVLPEILLTVLFSGVIAFWSESSMGVALKICLTLLFIILFFFQLLRRGDKSIENTKLRRIKRGADLMLIGGISALTVFIAMTVWISQSNVPLWAKITAPLAALVIIGITIFIGVIKVSVSSGQLKIKDHILMLMLWWCPIVNIFLVSKYYQTARREYIIEADRIELDNARAENSICKTKYPILLVHGIFFRDWQLVNYWGRVPAILIKNGATVFYGKQQSSLAVSDSAEELRNTILNVLKETGAEKVNIIAHSKGGLDSRYAISCLGMDKYVASLTTINTPHEGCDMVDYLLEKVPDYIKNILEKRYNAAFKRLGDTSPNFMAGVKDLSAKTRKIDNQLMPDSPDVLYRSYTSVMSDAGSANFLPLNFGYRLIKKLNGPNDGLVWIESAKHGEFIKCVSTSKKRGVSHGDVIDLMRENIDGFDVREFYVEMVSGLKGEGF